MKTVSPSRMHAVCKLDSLQLPLGVLRSRWVINHNFIPPLRALLQIVKMPCARLPNILQFVTPSLSDSPIKTYSGCSRAHNFNHNPSSPFALRSVNNARAMHKYDWQFVNL